MSKQAKKEVLVKGDRYISMMTGFKTYERILYSDYLSRIQKWTEWEVKNELERLAKTS